MTPQDHREELIARQAREWPPAERARFLDGVCAGDISLRERVEVLLAVQSDPKDGLGPTVVVDSQALTPTRAILEEGPGSVIGRYRLLEKVGEGGFGAVYVAEQKEPVKRRVALKIIKLGMDTKQVIARFEAERQALAMMEHPNIAKVLDAGTTESGRPYFIMELVRGIKITEYCDTANLSTRDRMDLFIKVCQAIQHAHQKGIIHRDIKPSNILVTLQDGVPMPKVIDFGIAKATEGRLTDATVYTQLHQFIGTPAYISPEQAEMSALDVDTRSDIYSLGVLLYELLTGKTPFDVQELMAQGLDAMRRTIREREPAKPSTRLASLKGDELTTTAKRRSVEAAKLTKLVRGDLDWIVMKCLEKDRTRRYETANGLAADLKRHLNDEPVVARPPSKLYEFQRTVRRHKLGFAATAAIILALLAGVVMSARQAVRARRAEKLAKDRLAEVAKERDAKEFARQDAEAISKFLSEVFQSPDPARDGRTITVAETLDKAAKKLDIDLATQPARRAKLQVTLGKTYFALGLYGQVIQIEEKVRDYYLSILGPEHPDTLTAMQRLAVGYSFAGRREEALKLREEVLRLRRKVLGPEHPDTLAAMNNLALSYFDAGRLDEALKLREEVLTLRHKVLGPEHPDTLLAMSNLALSYFVAGRRDEALKMREEVLTLRRKVNGPEHPDTLMAMNNLSISYDTGGRREEALKLRQELLALQRKVNGPEHPDTLLAMQNLALSYADTGRRDEALKLREEVLTLRRKANNPEHPDTIMAMLHVASSYADAGRRDEALKLRQEAVRLYRKVLGPEHPDTIIAMHELANSCADCGRQAEALNMREEVLRLRRKVLGPENPDTLSAMRNLAISYVDVGRGEEALKLYEELLTLYRKVLGPKHPDTVQSLNDLAWFLATNDAAERRDGAKAVRLAEEAVMATSRKNPDYLDTLAAAYAETRLFDKAAAAEREAIVLFRTEPQKQDARSHLQLYQASRPYHEQRSP